MKKELIAITVFLLAGCNERTSINDDIMEANNDNFTKILNIGLKKDPVCFNQNITGVDSMYIFMFKFPVTVSKKNNPRYLNQTGHLDKFVELGLVSSRSEQVKDLVGRTYTSKIYDLTKKGKIYYRDEMGEKFYKEQKFCFGKKAVKEIVQFTEPAVMNGVKVSNVKFTYFVNDIPDWAKSDYLKNALATIIDSKDKPIAAETTLILTNKGWSVNF